MTQTATMPLSTRHDPDFRATLEERLYNRLTPSRMPDVAVRPSDEAGVAEAVRLARRDGLRIAVQSGGAHWSGMALHEGGLLIDLAALDTFAIDATGRRATLGPGLRSSDFGDALAAQGLAFPVGHCGVPAMGGFLLGGGLGLNWGHWKPACYSVASARVVTAAGDVVLANADTNPDLLWLLRGAGPGFPGIVTEFTVSLQARPRDTRVSNWWFDLDALDAVTEWVSQASAGLPSHVEVAVTTLGPHRDVLPPGPGVPDHLVCVTALAYVDNLDEAHAALAALADPPATGLLLHAGFDAVPFEKLYLGAEAAHPRGHRVIGDTFWSDGKVHDVLPPLREVLGQAPSAKNSVVVLMPGHGAADTGVPRDAAVYSMDRRTLILAYATWTDAADDAANAAWMHEVVKCLEPVSTGHFIGEADLSIPDRARRSFSPGNWDRLCALQAKWDPDGVFHGFGAVR